jgi:Leucine-rich repeat (LRR) protein
MEDEAEDNSPNLEGYSIVETDSEGNALAISTRECRDVERWKVMPALDHLAKMRTLDLHKSRYLQTLSSSIGNLSNLRELNLTRCEQLQCLPPCIGNLTNLEVSTHETVDRIESPDEAGIPRGADCFSHSPHKGA